jgi:hypothetical protein
LRRRLPGWLRLLNDKQSSRRSPGMSLSGCGRWSFHTAWVLVVQKRSGGSTDAS